MPGDEPAQRMTDQRKRAADHSASAQNELSSVATIFGSTIEQLGDDALDPNVSTRFIKRVTSQSMSEHGRRNRA